MKKTSLSELLSPSPLEWQDPVDQPAIVTEDDQDSLWDQWIAARGAPTNEVIVNDAG